jgi:serine/threonine-protein kinase HipA
MTSTLNIWIDDALAGYLHHDSQNNQFAFEYAAEWLENHQAFPVSPAIPIPSKTNNGPIQSAERHSAIVKQFFENLLPEGDALDVAAQANRVAKSNLVGLILALGRETAGAIRVSKSADNPLLSGSDVENSFREITQEELSERIQARQRIPFSQWDGKVRLSIAGYQDKIAIYKKNDKWFLVEGARIASTYIVKPLPQREQLATLPANEFFCMKLAQAVGVNVADVDLQFVPEPVLFVKRFDRAESEEGVQRLHVIDGCQALGLSVSMKYERPYGDSRDVKDIRDGASYPKLFALINQCAKPARDRLQLIRWVLFQVLIGNHDAHGKNISFFLNQEGLSIAPAYDLVCIPALGDGELSPQFGMAVGDAFTEADINAEEWLAFAHDCKLKPKMLARELNSMSQKITDALPSISDICHEKNISCSTTENLVSIISAICDRQRAIAKEILSAV